MNAALLPPDLSPQRIVATLGLISDTHMPLRFPLLPPSVYDIFAGVDLVLHAGDVGELWVLDQLSAIAPVVAVHGNDETEEARQALVYQQIVAVGGHRLLLCHGHLPDRAAEKASRAGDDWRPKLSQRARQARAVSAHIMVFGHLHIPFVCRHEGVWLINPGAIASGSFLTRQTRQTVAVLFMRDDGMPFVTFVDLARAGRSYAADVEWDAGFNAAAGRYSASIAGPAVVRATAAMRNTPFFQDPRVIACMSRLGMLRWRGETTDLISMAELQAAIVAATDFTAAEQEELLQLIRRA